MLTQPQPPTRTALRARMAQHRSRLQRLAGAMHYGADALLIAADAMEDCWRDRPENEAAMGLAADLRQLAPRYATPVPVAPAPASQDWQGTTWAMLHAVAGAVREGLALRLGASCAQEVLDAIASMAAGPAAQAEIAPVAVAILFRRLRPQMRGQDPRAALAASVEECLLLTEPAGAPVLALLHLLEALI